MGTKAPLVKRRKRRVIPKSFSSNVHIDHLFSQLVEIYEKRHPELTMTDSMAYRLMVKDTAIREGLIDPNGTPDA